MRDNELRPIVVGVDGSAAGAAALRWAVGEARRHDCTIDAISVWHMDYGLMMAPEATAAGLDTASIEAASRSALDVATADVGDVDLRRILIEGDAKKLLVEMSRDARMLVVGNRGHSAVAELLLGSVSAYCVRHASCPVVVVKAL
ncbi:universal stress protein [Lentzea flaviverrucosa]|uniref:Nucleotide-binding universal stress protein, UspA family n=1 Tax=Lentzea flaviverrucosa TaxID=200379 RepID=A0A1H9XXL9_9PSEU|nr:universal stress protein [Lentzea flaviverrucosa]RDI34332.1 nucleotide-binding universal stress UspA family protein [Lentzea flaviverrucosa]SES50497.1 Nucleotide-binding universal stress protein, UspA family [Lentzea flaviverrucosa]